MLELERVTVVVVDVEPLFPAFGSESLPRTVGLRVIVALAVVSDTDSRGTASKDRTPAAANAANITTAAMTPNFIIAFESLEIIANGSFGRTYFESLEYNDSHE